MLPHSNADILSAKECLRWMRSKFWKKRKWNPRLNEGGELPYAAFCRAVKLDPGTVAHYLSGKDPIPKDRIGPLSRFIRDWENGLIEFTPKGTKLERRPDGRVLLAGPIPRQMVHRDTPKKMPVIARVTFANGPKLSWVEKPRPAHRFPEFKDAFELIRKTDP